MFINLLIITVNIQRNVYLTYKGLQRNIDIDSTPVFVQVFLNILRLYSHNIMLEINLLLLLLN